jgi:hypothetical protein
MTAYGVTQNLCMDDASIVGIARKCAAKLNYETTAPLVNTSFFVIVTIFDK